MFFFSISAPRIWLTENNSLNSGIKITMRQEILMRIYLIMMVYLPFVKIIYLPLCGVPPFLSQRQWRVCFTVLFISLVWFNFSDDTTKAVRSLAGSKLPSHLGLDEKMEFLQRAEERYYQNNISDRQVETTMLCTLVFAVMNDLLGKISKNMTWLAFQAIQRGKWQLV